METNREPAVIGNMIKNKVLRYELWLIVLFLAGLMIKYLHVPFSGLINTLLLTTLSIIYFFSAFATLDEPEGTGFDNFIYKLCGFSSSVVVIGILFESQRWPGGSTMFNPGAITLAVILIYILIQKSKRPELGFFNRALMVRILVLILVSVGMIYSKLR